MQIFEVQRLISEVYNILTQSSEYQEIADYIRTEELLHDNFWEKYNKLRSAKSNLRIAVNDVSERSEKLIATVEELRLLIQRDKQNKKKLKKEENMKTTTNKKEREVV